MKGEWTVPAGSRRIPSAPNYFATPDGEIFSKISGVILSGGIGSNGRKQVVVIVEGKRLTRGVHVLVCEAFHGRRPTSKVVSHLDGNRLNNAPHNLAWETQAENNSRKVAHGTHDRGFNNSRAALTPEMVDSIFRMREVDRMTHKAIAQALRVSRTTISRVLNGLRYETDVHDA